MKWNFHGWPRKNNVEFLGVLVFGPGISKGSNKNLWNFQEWSFVLSGISRGKVKNERLQEVFKNVCRRTPPPPSPMNLCISGWYCFHCERINKYVFSFAVYQNIRTFHLNNFFKDRYYKMYFPANTQRWFNVDICWNNIVTSVNVISKLIQLWFVNIDSSINLNVETTLILDWI